MKNSLEEAAVINYKKLYEGEPLTQDIPIDAFKQGAKWQKERSYSEKEVLTMLLIKHDGLTPEYVLQQFKKK